LLDLCDVFITIDVCVGIVCNNFTVASAFAFIDILVLIDCCTSADIHIVIVTS